MDAPKLTLREKLDIIDGWLAEFTSDAQALSAILSALRGPDISTQDTASVKNSTTNVIRKVAFPKAYAATMLGGFTGWCFTGTTHAYTSPLDPVTNHHEAGWHFMSHVDSAATALGIHPDLRKERR